MKGAQDGAQDGSDLEVGKGNTGTEGNSAATTQPGSQVSFLVTQALLYATTYEAWNTHAFYIGF